MATDSVVTSVKDGGQGARGCCGMKPQPGAVAVPSTSWLMQTGPRPLRASQLAPAWR